MFIGKLQNLYCVDNTDTTKCTIWRSEQPTASDFVEMQQKLGLKSVIKWNSALHELVDDIDNAPKPTDGHCELGDDRTSIIFGF